MDTDVELAADAAVVVTDVETPPGCCRLLKAVMMSMMMSHPDFAGWHSVSPQQIPVKDTKGACDGSPACVVSLLLGLSYCAPCRVVCSCYMAIVLSHRQPPRCCQTNSHASTDCPIVVWR